MTRCTQYCRRQRCSYQLYPSVSLEDATYEQTMFSPVQSRTVFQSELTHSRQVSCNPNRGRDATGLTLKLCTGTLPSSLCAWRGGTSSKTVVMPPGITKGCSAMLASSDERGEGKGEYEDRMKHCKTRQSYRYECSG